MYSNSPLISIKKFDLADSVRPGKRRVPGECVVLRNTAPALSGGERVRRGYKSYTQVLPPSTGGYVADLLKVCQIQSPSQEDVHLWFATNGTKNVFMNPWWQLGVKQTTNLQLSETLDLSGQAVTYPTANTMALTGAPLGQADDYFNGWALKVGSKFALVTDWVSSTNTFTFVEDVDASGLNLGGSITGTFYRNFHDNLGFSPSYNTDLVNPPVANAQNSIVRFSGGQGSNAALRGVWVTPYVKRVFFPGIAARKFTYEGTYASERETKATDYGRQPFPVQFFLSKALDLNKTYWIAVAPVYDGFQLGTLTRYETGSNYPGGTGWTENFLHADATTNQAIQIGVQLNAGKLNKRITGFAFYAAQDSGDTRSIGRQSDYFFIGLASTVDSNGLSGQWTYVGSTSQAFEIHFAFDGAVWDKKGNPYVLDSGYVEIPSDTMYSYSDEVLVGESRRYLSNCYITSESKIDREKLFINPVGGNANINAGLVQPDIFSNEDGIYRKAPEPTIGTKIQAMKAIGLEDLLIIKDRGLLLGRQIVDAAGFPDFLWSIISYEVGCTTIQQATQADDGWIYFPGYDDIYRYRGGAYQSLIRSGDSNDWLNTYREVITKAMKESTVIWYLPEGVVYFDIAQTNGYQYAFYPPRANALRGEIQNFGWRQVNFKQTSGLAATQFFKFMTRLQNGTVLGTTSDSPAQFIQFANPTDLTFYYDDDGTPIKAQIDTGDFLLGGDEAIDARWDKLAIDTTKDVPTTGTLDVSVWKDTVLLKTVLGLDKSDIRAVVQSATDEPRIGQLWRVAWNVNLTTPEVMQSNGKILQINSIDWFFDKLPYLKRASVIPLTGGETCMQTLGTVGGVREVRYLTANVDQTFTFDVPFTETYSSFDGTTQPKYGITFTRARDNYGVGGEIDTEQVTLVSKTLTGFTINVPTGTVLVEFAIV